MKKKIMDFNQNQRLESDNYLNELCRSVFSNEAALLAYWPLALEPDLRPFYRYFISKGSCLYLPRIEFNQLIFRRVLNFDNCLELGSFSLKVPKLTCPKSLNTNIPIIIPSLSFNKENKRLGYGKGFYDKFLANYDGYRYGICYHFQKQSWKADHWDQAVSKLLCI